MAAKTTRLLKGVCFDVVSELILNNLKVKIPLWEAEGALLMQDIYEASFSAELRAKMESFSPEMFPNSRFSQINIRCTKHSISQQFRFNGGVFGYHYTPGHTLYEIWRGCENPTVSRMLPNENTITLEEGSQLALRAAAYIKANYKNQINCVDQSIKTAANLLFSLKTLEAVETGWPEIYPHLKARITANFVKPTALPIQLPMISTYQMNDVLGIPKELLVAV